MVIISKLFTVYGVQLIYITPPNMHKKEHLTSSPRQSRLTLETHADADAAHNVPMRRPKTEEQNHRKQITREKREAHEKISNSNTVFTLYNKILPKAEEVTMIHDSSFLTEIINYYSLRSTFIILVNQSLVVNYRQCEPCIMPFRKLRVRFKMDTDKKGKPFATAIICSICKASLQKT